MVLWVNRSALESGKLNNFQDNVRKFLTICDQELGIDQVADTIEISSKKLRKISQNGDVDLFTFAKIISTYNLSIDRLSSDKLDENFVASSLNEKSYLPSSYRNAAYTSRSVGHNILSFLENKYGEAFRRQCLNYMYTTDDVFNQINSNLYVCTQWTGDLLKYLRNFKGLTENDLYLMGLHSGFYYKDKQFGRSFKGLSAQKAYTKLLEEVFLCIDYTFMYEMIKCNSNVTIIRKRFSPLMLEELKTKIYSTRETCIHSTGFGASVAYLANGNFAQGTHSKCLFKSDPYCEFIFEYGTTMESLSPAESIFLL